MLVLPPPTGCPLVHLLPGLNLNASDLINKYQQTPTHIILKYPQYQNMGSFGYTPRHSRVLIPLTESDRQLQWHPNSQRHGLLPQPAAGRTITGHARFQAVPGDPLMDGATLKKKKVRHLEDEV